MTREERSVSLVVLTLIVYSIFMYLDKGALLFPYPLNEAIFLIICLQFVWWKKDNLTPLTLLPAASALFNLLSTQFFWSFWLNNVQMEQLTSSALLDILKLVYFLILGIWAFLTVRKVNGTTQAHGLITVILFMIPAVFPFSIVEMIPLIIMAIFATRYKIQNTNHLLWILLATLQMMKVAMLCIS